MCSLPNKKNAINNESFLTENFNAETIVRLEQIAKLNRLNTNQSSEFYQTIKELQLKNNAIDFGLLDGFEPNGSNRASEFVEFYRALRAPQYQELRTQLKSYLKTLNSLGVRFIYKDNFEDNKVKLELEFQTVEELERNIEKIRSKKEVLSDLLRLINGQ